MRSGFINLEGEWDWDGDGDLEQGATFGSAGGNGYSWSSVALKVYSGNSYSSSFNTSYNYPSSYGDRSYAFSLRCLSTVLDR